MSDTFTLSTKEICPIMADVMNAMLVANLDFSERKIAVAVAALGVALVTAQGLDPSGGDMIEGLDMLAQHFLDGIERAQARVDLTGGES